VGYVPQLSTAVWIGNDNYTPMRGGTTGGTYAAPVWKDFMQQALVNVPVENFRRPSELYSPRGRLPGCDWVKR
jgi:penicillin-binding protein 1A